MKYILMILILCSASIQTLATSKNVSEKDMQAAQNLIKALKANDKAAVASMIRYPLRRQEPLVPIVNAKEFQEHYEEYFNASTIVQVEQGLNDILNNWQGTALGGGLIWLDAGQIISINLGTDLQKQALKKAKAEELSSLHPSARNFERTWMICKTQKHFIRIQSLIAEDKVHYFSWKAGIPNSEKPELELAGIMDIQGSGGNTLFTFKNGKYTYEIYKSVVCGEDCNSYLTVKKDGKEIQKDRCLELVN